MPRRPARELKQNAGAQTSMPQQTTGASDVLPKPRWLDKGSLHYNLAVALYRNGDSNEAVAECKRELLIGVPDPDHAGRCHFWMGINLEWAGSLDGAIEEYRQATTLAPGVADYHYKLGRLLQDKDDIPRACSEGVFRGRCQSCGKRVPSSRTMQPPARP